MCYCPAYYNNGVLLAHWRPVVGADKSLRQSGSLRSVVRAVVPPLPFFLSFLFSNLVLFSSRILLRSPHELKPQGLCNLCNHMDHESESNLPGPGYGFYQQEDAQYSGLSYPQHMPYQVVPNAQTRTSFRSLPFLSFFLLSLIFPQQICSRCAS